MSRRELGREFFDQFLVVSSSSDPSSDPLIRFERKSFFCVYQKFGHLHMVNIRYIIIYCIIYHIYYLHVVPPEEDAHADLVDIDLTYIAMVVKMMFVFVLIS